MLKFHARTTRKITVFSFVQGKKWRLNFNRLIIHDASSGEANIYLFSGINFPASAIA